MIFFRLSLLLKLLQVSRYTRQEFHVQGHHPSNRGNLLQVFSLMKELFLFRQKHHFQVPRIQHRHFLPIHCQHSIFLYPNCRPYEILYHLLQHQQEIHHTVNLHDKSRLPIHCGQEENLPHEVHHHVLYSNSIKQYHYHQYKYFREQAPVFRHHQHPQAYSYGFRHHIRLLKNHFPYQNTISEQVSYPQHHMHRLSFLYNIHAL